MEAPLQEALNQSKFSITLSQHLHNAYAKFLGNCVFAYRGGIFKVDRELILWAKYSVDARVAIVLDSNNKPIEVESQLFWDAISKVWGTALRAYRQEYDAIIQSRSVKKLIDV